jgi:transposase
MRKPPVIPPRRPYATDLTEAEWQLLVPLIPAPKPGGRQPLHDRRELVNAMAYWLRAGCAWRLLPHDLPPWQAVYHHFRSWRQQGLWEQVHATLRTPGADPPRPSAHDQRGHPDELMGHEASGRSRQHQGSAMGAHYRHTTPEMATRVADAIQQRLAVVLQVAERTIEDQPTRSMPSVF